MAEVEIGIGKTARRAYRLDDVAIVPTKRTRDPEDVDISCDIDAYHLDLPILGAPADSVTSPATAVEMGRLGAVGVLHLEGLWTRYDDPEPLFDEIAGLSAGKATRRLQEIYAEPVRPGLIPERVAQIKDAGVTSAVAVTPNRTLELADAVLRAEPDLLVIQGTIVSAEHVSASAAQPPLNLKTFIADLDVPVVVGGCTNYQTALHLMRTGAAGVIVGVAADEWSTTSD
ncbi:MAG TPA: IMP dehydrogenase, partial [Acidimicrobiales bacterium]